MKSCDLQGIDKALIVLQLHSRATRYGDGVGMDSNRGGTSWRPTVQWARPQVFQLCPLLPGHGCQTPSPCLFELPGPNNPKPETFCTHKHTEVAPPPVCPEWAGWRRSWRYVLARTSPRRLEASQSLGHYSVLDKELSSSCHNKETIVLHIMYGRSLFFGNLNWIPEQMSQIGTLPELLARVEGLALRPVRAGFRV